MDKKLLDGVIEFRNDYFEEHKKLFENLENRQQPHTLYIGCSDSRIVPNIITSSFPGELFVIRNIANMIPPYNLDSTTFRCTASVIEYAVKMLNIKNIIVCGHSNCGGCKALYYSEEKLNQLPNVKKWLELGRNIRDRVLKKNLSSVIERDYQTEHLNIVQQLDNLFTYPFVLEKFKSGEIDVMGWYYVIETGKVFNYNFKNREFELLGN